MGTFFTPVSSSPAGRKCNLVFTTHLISFLARTSKPRPNSDTSALKTKIITKTNDKIVQSCKKTTFDILKCLAARLRGHKGNWLMIPVYSFLLFVSSRPYYRKSSIKPPPPPPPLFFTNWRSCLKKIRPPGGLMEDLQYQAEFQYIESGLLFDVAGQELFIAQSAVSSQKEN